jgi:putative transposase
VLRQFGTGRRRAVAGYIDFVRAGVGLPSVWDGLRGQVFLGSDAFVEAMTQELDMDDPKLRDVPRVQRRPPPKTLVPLIESVPACEADADGIAPRVPSRVRDAAMAAAYATGHHTLRAIADAFGVHETTVSRALRRANGNGSSKERGL